MLSAEHTTLATIFFTKPTPPYSRCRWPSSLDQIADGPSSCSWKGKLESGRRIRSETFDQCCTSQLRRNYTQPNIFGLRLLFCHATLQLPLQKVQVKISLLCRPLVKLCDLKLVYISLKWVPEFATTAHEHIPAQPSPFSRSLPQKRRQIHDTC